jgi:hypothetical protein
MKFLKTPLGVISALFATALFAATVVTIDNSSGSLDEAPNCRNGMKLLTFSNLPGRSSGAFSSNSFYGCFANPTKFEVKIYSISLVDLSDNETVIYQTTNPSYVDIINNQFNPVRDLASLTPGTYKSIKLTLDYDYKITLDEQVASDSSGNVSRVITYPAGIQIIQLTTLA